MICPQCGFKNGKRAKFCNECGALLYNAQTEKDPANATDAAASFNYLNTPYAAPSSIENPDRDTSGFDEYLIGADYVPPKPSWKTGGTMEMPRVEGKQPERKEYRAPSQDEKSGRGRLIVFIALALVSLIILTTAAVTYQMEIWGGKSLPDVVKKHQDEATAILEERGFTVKALQVKSDEEENLVLLMDPGAGRRLSEGSEVVLQVATPRVIPEVVGKSLEEAQAAFEQEGFERVEYVKTKSDEAENTVLSVEPASGGQAKASTPIRVTVSEAYVVPNIDIASIDPPSAVTLIESAGFVAEVIYVYSEQAEGSIIKIDPASGTKLPSGSTVTIQVAKSRATELVAATQNYLSSAGTLQVQGTTYELVSVDGVSYVEGNTTLASLTVRGVTTLPDGEVVYGSHKPIQVTFAWNDDNTISSYA